MQHLHDLLRSFDPQFNLDAVPNLQITGIREDSRLVQPGDLFLARSGALADGRQFIADAAERGAVAVVVDSTQAPCPLPQIAVGHAALSASMLANLFYGQPSGSIKVLAVTGTNGKTTTAYLLRHLLNHLGRRCGMIGTVAIDDGRTQREATMTTPGAVDVAELLAGMRDRGCRACAIETSSHALHQGRVAGVHFAGGAFTNLTGDHLDYHKTMEAYADAKAKLFESLADGTVAAINDKDPYSLRMVRDCPARIIRFGFGPTADYRARDIAETAQGSHFVLHTPDGRAEVSISLIGRHNIENALAAAALAGEVFGLSVHQLAAGLKEAQGAPGRLQAVRLGQPFAVLVDYAHTDDALQNVLVALRPLTRGRLRVLFGCGGDRDRTKRPRMARTASRLADDLYITSDNPRTENPQTIIDEIVSGLSADRARSAIIEPDRRAAIERVLGDAEDGDVVLIAGKGHENYQIIGSTKHHFDDVEQCTQVLTGRLVR